MSSEKPGCLAALFGVRSRRTGSQPVSPSAPIPKSTSKPQAVTLPYRLSAKLLSPAAANFYRIIKQMVGEHLLIFPKMGLKEFLLITDQSNFKAITIVLIESMSIFCFATLILSNPFSRLSLMMQAIVKPSADNETLLLRPF